MVINDLNVLGAVSSLRPFETDAPLLPLLIDPNVVPALPVTGQGLQPVAGQPGQIP